MGTDDGRRGEQPIGARLSDGQPVERNDVAIDRMVERFTARLDHTLAEVLGRQRRILLGTQLGSVAVLAALLIATG